MGGCRRSVGETAGATARMRTSDQKRHDALSQKAFASPVPSMSTVSYSSFAQYGEHGSRAALIVARNK